MSKIHGSIIIMILIFGLGWGMGWMTAYGNSSNAQLSRIETMMSSLGQQQKLARSVTAPPVPAKESPQVFAINMTGSPSLGSEDAAVTIVEFTDYECPYCKSSQPTIEQVIREYGDKVRLVVKHNPLSLHQNAQGAAKASIAAAKQGKFWEMHKLLFVSQQQLDPASLYIHRR